MQPRLARRSTLVLPALVLAIVLLHLWASVEVAHQVQGLRGTGSGPALERMEANYVSEVRLTRPPVAVAAPPEAAAPARAVAPSPVASAPESAQPPAPSVPEDSTPPTPDTHLALAQAPASAGDAGGEAGAAEGGAPGSDGDDRAPAPKDVPPPPPPASSTPPDTEPDVSPRFVWPKATRVSYTVDGYWRGPVTGKASVEWVREGKRYQVHMEADAGVVSSRFSSEGEIQAQGLYPKVFERVISVPIRGDTRTVIRMDADEVTLPDGKKMPRPEGAQDAVSFLIHLSYSFMLNPEKLVPGQSFKLQLMLPKRVEDMSFDVVGEEPIDTPLGRIQALRVKPRSARADAGDLPADVWFAPGLMYLPVRITMAFKDGSALDLQMSRAPQLAPGEGPR